MSDQAPLKGRCDSPDIHLAFLLLLHPFLRRDLLVRFDRMLQLIRRLLRTDEVLIDRSLGSDTKGC